MKTLLKVMVIGLAIFFALKTQAQNILIADNNPGAVAVPGAVFTGATALQDAITAAEDDDIIQVIRGTNNYGSIVIDKRLNIFGVGLNPDTEGGIRSMVTVVDIPDPSASGTRLSGIVVTQVINLGGNAGSLNNLLIENSDIVRVEHISNTTTLVNLIIRNCLLGENIGAVQTETIDLIAGYVSNVVIANNVIYGSWAENPNDVSEWGSVSADQATIENNIFVHADQFGVNYWRAFYYLTNSSVKNNIFFGISPQGKAALSNNSFENNISWQTGADTFSTGNGNTSISNYEGVDPGFANVARANNAGSLTIFDPSVSGTEALTGATDGGQIGVYGGPIPFSLEGTFIPTIQVLDVPSMVIEGNTLDVRIQAKGN